MPTLDELNAASLDVFVDALDGVFEHAPWVAAKAAAMRPFATVTALHEALIAQVRAASEESFLAFLCGHPELSPKALADPALTSASRDEQGGLGLDSLGEDLRRFEDGNAEYRAKFGFPFIVCVRRLTPPFVLRAMGRRLASSMETERETAIGEIGFITRLRLKDRVTGPGMPKTSGHLSTHVLDTARGRPAAKLTVLASTRPLLFVAHT